MAEEEKSLGAQGGETPGPSNPETPSPTNETPPAPNQSPEMTDLMAERQVKDAVIEVLKSDHAMFVSLMEKSAAREERRLAIEEAKLKIDKANLEKTQLPETERPTEKGGWINLTRETITRLRDRGEVLYSQYIGLHEELKKVLSSIPTEKKEDRELKSVLTKEVFTMSQEDKLASQWSERGGSFKSLGELTTVVASGASLSPEFLISLSHLSETKTPVWLEGIVPSDQSMSVYISRSVYLYTSFFGRWSELIDKKLNGQGGIEEQVRNEWKTGKLGISKVQWNRAVTKRLGDEKWDENTKLSEINKEVLQKLGFGSEGKVSSKILKLIFNQESLSDEMKNNNLYKQMNERVSKLSENDGLSLLDLLKIEKGKPVNIFADNVNKKQLDYSRWVLSSLCGSSYADGSAFRFLIYTGETGKLNVLDAAGAAHFDVFCRLCNSETRRLAEARKGRPAGPPITLGRYPGLGSSWSETASELKIPTRQGEEEDKRIIDALREGAWFHSLPWEQIGAGDYIPFLISVGYAGRIFEDVITNRNIDLTGREGLLESPDILADINKRFSDIFKRWDWVEGRDKNDRKDLFEKREEWAKAMLNKNLKEFGKEKWSPWFTLVFGVIAEHLPSYEKHAPQDELQSPTGMKMGKILPIRVWDTPKQKLDYTEGKLSNAKSILSLLELCEDTSFLTESEMKVVYKIFGF